VLGLMEVGIGNGKRIKPTQVSDQWQNFVLVLS
jgi:hypothetical protein